MTSNSLPEELQKIVNIMEEGYDQGMRNLGGYARSRHYATDQDLYHMAYNIFLKKRGLRDVFQNDNP